MNAGRDGAVTTFMNDKLTLTPKEKEIQSLFARGKSPTYSDIG